MNNTLYKQNQVESLLRRYDIKIQINGFQLHIKCKRFKTYQYKVITDMQQGKQTVWLDCDPGLDDTFAIIYAACDKNINLLGVSTSPGNTNLHNTTQNALDVLYNIGRKDVLVYSGSNLLLKGEMKLAEHVHGSNGLGGVKLPTSPQKALTQGVFQKIYYKIKGCPSQVVWANTGSLTNICILLLAYPDIKQKISKIIIMGGAMGRGNITPAAQFNIYFDAHAFDQMLRLKGDIPFYMIPLEVTHQNMATQQVFDHFHRNKEIPFSEAVYNMLEQFKIMYFNNYKIPYPPIHDPLTIFYILHPEEIEMCKTYIEVDTGDKSYGRTNCYFQGPRNPNIDKESVNWVATNLKNDKVKFWDEMLKILDHIFSQKTQKLIVNE